MNIDSVRLVDGEKVCFSVLLCGDCREGNGSRGGHEGAIDRRNGRDGIVIFLGGAELLAFQQMQAKTSEPSRTGTEITAFDKWRRCRLKGFAAKEFQETHGYGSSQLLPPQLAAIGSTPEFSCDIPGSRAADQSRWVWSVSSLNTEDEHAKASFVY